MIRWLAVIFCLVPPVAGLLVVNVLVARAWPVYPLPLLSGLGLLLQRRSRAYDLTVLAAAVPLVALLGGNLLAGSLCRRFINCVPPLCLL